LVNIATSLNTTVLTVAPVVTGAVVPLAVGEVEALVGALGDIKNIVSDIESTLLSTVGSLVAGKLFMTKVALFC
jgi:hypothetical protein